MEKKRGKGGVEKQKNTKCLRWRKKGSLSFYQGGKKEPQKIEEEKKSANNEVFSISDGKQEP